MIKKTTKAIISKMVILSVTVVLLAAGCAREPGGSSTVSSKTQSNTSGAAGSSSSDYSEVPGESDSSSPVDSSSSDYTEVPGESSRGPGGSSSTGGYTSTPGGGGGGTEEGKITDWDELSNFISKYGLPENKSADGELATVMLDYQRSGSFETLSKNAPMFHASNCTFDVIVPQGLAGKKYLYGPVNEDIVATVTKSGWVYILTQAIYGPRGELKRNGFETIATYDIGKVSSLLNIVPLVLMGKKVSVGETVTCSTRVAFAILFANGYKSVVTPPPIDGGTIKLTARDASDTCLQMFADREDGLPFSSNWEKFYWANGDSGIYVDGIKTNVPLVKVGANHYLVHHSYGYTLKDGLEIKIEGYFKDGDGNGVTVKSCTFKYDADDGEHGRWKKIS